MNLRANKMKQLWVLCAYDRPKNCEKLNEQLTTALILMTQTTNRLRKHYLNSRATQTTQPILEKKKKKIQYFVESDAQKSIKKTQTFLKSNNVNCSRAVLCASVQCACVVSAGRWNIH